MEWGTVPQWVTAISSTAVTGLIGTLVVAWWRRGVDITRLTSEELARVVGRQRECEEREEILRQRVQRLEAEVEGLYRTLIASSADRVLMLGDDVPEHIRELARKTLEAQKRGL